ncbi:hypothetical protein AVEN_21174-1 [Araneus ventricosus]|uniref:Uncharacterized protein n=1 Tax=Araneus ventricosus TaxID=182803 RepID=A0A4Y2X798_ARAVE|nr:hypothetical protein AVEN_21174-1 [Araneus ventricosus]
MASRWPQKSGIKENEYASKAKSKTPLPGLAGKITLLLMRKEFRSPLPPSREAHARRPIAEARGAPRKVIDSSRRSTGPRKMPARKRRRCAPAFFSMMPRSRASTRGERRRGRPCLRVSVGM